MRRFLNAAKRAASAAAFFGGAFAASTGAAEGEAQALRYWSGPYFGAHVGVGAAGIDSLYNNGTIGLPGRYQAVVRGEFARLDGGLGGVHAGFLTEGRGLLFGLEADWSHLNWNERLIAPDPGVSGPDFATYHLNWLASLRARIAAPSGRSLFHFSPGVAYLDADYRAHRIDTLFPANEGFDLSGLGYVVGGGMQHALAPDWSLSVEGFYYGFNIKEQAELFGPTFDPADYARIDGLGLVRLGLTYRLNGGEAVPETTPAEWGGFYLGLAGGYGRSFQDSLFDADEINTTNDLDDSVFGELFKLHGSAASLQAGYNRELGGKLVVGVETDWTSLGLFDQAQDPDSEFPATDYASFDVDWLASARLRAGVVSGRTLFYATGGAAYVSATYEAVDPEGGVVSAGSIDMSGLGYVLGAGAEHAFNDRLRLTLEGRYYGFDREKDTSALNVDSDAGDFARLSGVTLMQVGLRYRLGEP